MSEFWFGFTVGVACTLLASPFIIYVGLLIFEGNNDVLR